MAETNIIQQKGTRHVVFLCQLHSPPSSVLGVSQEQQGLLNKVLHEQQDMTKAVRENDRRIGHIEETLKRQSESSTSYSSSGEKKRSVTQ